jgi:DNA-directed RNA polymerase subunit RPC12/RpoP
MLRLEIECKCGHRGTMLLPAARLAAGINLRCSQCGAKRRV